MAVRNRELSLFFQRGNNRQDVFFTGEDRRVYLKHLKAQCEKHKVEVLGYCLMTNHVHLVLTPATGGALAKVVGATHLMHTQRVNRRQERSGHLWQSRFYSCPIDHDHVLGVVHYVERNPVRAGLVHCPREFAWSSAPLHVGMADEGGLIDMAAWEEQMDRETWREMLSSPVGEADLRSVREHTGSGYPLLSDALLGRLERALGRHLRWRPVGRPKK